MSSYFYPDFSNYNLDNLLTDMKIGHEIEFYFDGECFFLETDFEFNREHGLTIDNHKYLLYHCESFETHSAKKILSGTSDEIFDYDLKDGQTLRNNFDKFSINLIY